ncbi:MAG TPA: ABC transporter permease [Syntrophorhabdaceae bacterium]|nr:ABC transporter permease [Syntrophorhabdaceae bacterium]
METVVREKMCSLPRRLPLRLKLGVLPAMLILIGFVLAAIFAEFLAPGNPKQIDLPHALMKPLTTVGATTVWLGTDKLGRDILSRIIFGARVSLTVALIGVIAAGSVGTFLGIIAGFKGGTVDSIISRAIDVMLGFPTILFALVLAIVLGPSLFNVALVVILVYWARYARQARGEALKVREMDYVTLARTAGCSNLVIMFRHIFPNVVNSLLIVSTVNIGTVITLEATLSFLGAGVPPPAPSWGTMCADGRDLLVSAWWVSFMPGLAITLVVLSGNIFGDWLRDRLDPNLRNI